MPVTLTKPTTRQLEDAHHTATRTARGGLDAETIVREYLRSIGHNTVDSTRYENMVLDIDCRHAVTGQGLSIKMQNKGVHTGRLCFETKRFDMRAAFKHHDTAYSTDDPLYAQLERENHNRFWVPSWYGQGTADWYIIGVGEALFKVKRVRLGDYVKAHGWDDYKYHVSPAIRLQHYGRQYTDYQVGLLRIDTLLSSGTMKRIK